MVAVAGTVRPQPMPEVARALIYLPDAILALERAGKAWNKTQLLDAIKSAETFIAAAKQAVTPAQEPFALPGSPNFERQARQRALDNGIATLTQVQSEVVGEYLTCCDHPDCSKCAGRGGIYRVAKRTGGV